MQDEVSDTGDSSTQSPGWDGSSWPAERTPSRTDAERAHRPLDQGFVRSFKHAILSDTVRDVEYIGDATESLIQASRPRNCHGFYPLTLGAELPELHLSGSSKMLLDTFHAKGYPNMALVHNIPVHNFSSTTRPSYLAYSMATIGSVIVSGNPETTHAMWSTANILITLSLEIDNREGRKLDLIHAWVLQATYGALCANWKSWQHMNTTHGYVVTAARRLCSDATSGSHCAAMPALLLADVLRSIHYGHHSMISTLRCLTPPTPVNLAALKIYKMTVLEGRVPPPELAKDGSLLALVAILAEIHTLAHVFHPLSTTATKGMQTTTSEQMAELICFHNPCVPFSPTNENRTVRQRLQKALNSWATAYTATSPRPTMVLYYFCKMYLVLPTLQILPSVASYPPRLSSNGAPSQEQQNLVDQGLRDAPEAYRYAWQVLEFVTQGQDITPSWFPITVFYASLVVWRTVSLQLDSAGHSPRKVIILFKDELRKMCWPCCETMISTLETLLA